MTLSITLAELEALNPCDIDARRAMFGERKSLTVAQALRAGATIRDILWVAGRTGRKDLCVRFALACARRVAHLNTDPRVQSALDATQAWLDDPCESTRNAAANAASATSYAAAARAARRAARAAAYAYAYADAAANAARKMEQDEQRKLLIQVFGMTAQNI